MSVPDITTNCCGLDFVFGLRINRDLNAHRPNQLPGDVCDVITGRTLAVLDSESPDLVLVQGDTSTALGAATAVALRGTPVGHIEAGLRSGNERSPFPEEIYRKKITKPA